MHPARPWKPHLTRPQIEPQSSVASRASVLKSPMVRRSGLELMAAAYGHGVLVSCLPRTSAISAALTTSAKVSVL
jgi:hypothetical protein